MVKNIGFIKAGKAIKFITNSYSPVGGDNEPSAILQALANKNPDKNFYLIGRSDFRKLSEKQYLDLFPYKNVIDCFKSSKGAPPLDFLHDYFKLNKIKIDFSIVMWGSVGTCHIPNTIKKTNGSGQNAKVLRIALDYSTHLIHWLNLYKVPYVELISDPRFKANQARDIIHLSEVSLSQYNFNYKCNHIISYENQNRIEEEISSCYAGIETAFLINRKKQTGLNSRGFVIVLNEGRPSRYKELNEWILKHNEEVNIYGQWGEEIMEDSRFKGSINLEELQMKLKNYRSTFIIPIKKGWVTSKYIEMIHAGIIPFFHPTYDEQDNTGLKKYLSVRDSKHLFSLVDRINNDDEFYIKFISKLRKMVCKDEYYDGTFINNQIMGSMIKNYSAPNLENFNKQEFNSLENLFE